MKEWDLIQTVLGPDSVYTSVDKRCLTNDGCIVDLGCLCWDWCEFFIGKKRVIGADPYEKTKKEHTEFFNGVVWDYNGTIKMRNIGVGASVFDDGEDVFEVKNWKTFCKDFNIDKISVLKLNIEGAEYNLLKSFTDDDFDRIDQIAVSFHDWMDSKWVKDTAECIALLESKNYTLKKLGNLFGWFLAVKNI